MGSKKLKMMAPGNPRAAGRRGVHTCSGKDTVLEARSPLLPVLSSGATRGSWYNSGPKGPWGQHPRLKEGARSSESEGQLEWQEAELETEVGVQESLIP